MTVLHIMQCTNLGGMEQVAFRVMEELRKDGFDFRIVSPRPFGRAWNSCGNLMPMHRIFNIAAGLGGVISRRSAAMFVNWQNSVPMSGLRERVPLLWRR